MAMTADCSSNHHSPRGTGGGGGSDDINSPRVRRKHLPSPWAQVVRGEIEQAPAVDQPQSPSPKQSASPPVPAVMPEQVSSSPSLPADDLHAVAESSDANSSNAASVRPKKLAWNKPLNEGASAATADARPLMGDAVSWPELSKSSKPVPKAGSAESSSPSRTVTQGSNSNSQVCRHFFLLKIEFFTMFGCPESRFLENDTANSPFYICFCIAPSRVLYP